MLNFEKVSIAKNKPNLRILYAENSLSDSEKYKCVISSHLGSAYNLQIEQCDSIDQVEKNILGKNEYDLVIIDSELVTSVYEERYEQIKLCCASRSPILNVTDFGDICNKCICIKANNDNYKNKNVTDYNLAGVILSFAFEQTKIKNNLKHLN